MISESYKKRAHDLVNKAKEKKLIKTYEEFCKTDLAKKTKLTEEEASYYTSKKKGG